MTRTEGLDEAQNTQWRSRGSRDSLHSKLFRKTAAHAPRCADVPCASLMLTTSRTTLFCLCKPRLPTFSRPVTRSPISQELISQTRIACFLGQQSASRYSCSRKAADQIRAIGRISLAVPKICSFPSAASRLVDRVGTTWVQMGIDGSHACV